MATLRDGFPALAMRSASPARHRTLEAAFEWRAEAARRGGLASPLLDVCHELYRETVALGHGEMA